MKNAALESPDLVRRRRQMFERLDGICPTPEILYSDITGVSVYRRESDDVIRRLRHERKSYRRPQVCLHGG